MIYHNIQNINSMSEIQSQETLKEILSYNFLKAEELANTLIKDYSNNIFLLKILGVMSLTKH